MNSLLELLFIEKLQYQEHELPAQRSHLPTFTQSNSDSKCQQSYNLFTYSPVSTKQGHFRSRKIFKKNINNIFFLCQLQNPDQFTASNNLSNKQTNIIYRHLNSSNSNHKASPFPAEERFQRKPQKFQKSFIQKKKKLSIITSIPARSTAKQAHFRPKKIPQKKKKKKPNNYTKSRSVHHKPHLNFKNHAPLKNQPCVNRNKFKKKKNQINSQQIPGQFATKQTATPSRTDSRPRSPQNGAISGRKKFKKKKKSAKKGGFGAESRRESEIGGLRRRRISDRA